MRKESVLSVTGETPGFMFMAASVITVRLHEALFQLIATLSARWDDFYFGT